MTAAFDAETFGELELEEQIAIWRAEFGDIEITPMGMMTWTPLDDDEVDHFRRLTDTERRLREGRRLHLAERGEPDDEYVGRDQGAWRAWATDAAVRDRIGAYLAEHPSVARSEPRTRMTPEEYRERERLRAARYRQRMRAGEA
jgi:hypothetical protein